MLFTSFFPQGLSLYKPHRVEKDTHPVLVLFFLQGLSLHKPHRAEKDTHPVLDLLNPLLSIVPVLKPWMVSEALRRQDSGSSPERHIPVA